MRHRPQYNIKPSTHLAAIYGEAVTQNLCIAHIRNYKIRYFAFKIPALG